MKKGYLIVETFIGERVSPVIGTKVTVECELNDILHEGYTDENGRSERMPLKAASADEPNDPWHVPPSRKYKVTVKHKRGFREVIVHGVEIFPGVDSILPVRMIPDLYADSDPYEIFIPERREVGLGATSLSAVPENVSVYENGRKLIMPFKDYIKNIASGGTVQNLEHAALGANILIQMSDILGKGLDITACGAGDYEFDSKREISDNVSKVVDEIWGCYFVAKDNRAKTPIFDEEWMQSVRVLAIRGYNPVQIVAYLCPGLEVAWFGEKI